jgi:hypothetical protein
MHNAILEDEQTGEKVLLWAVLSERITFPNDLPDQPIDTDTAATDVALAENINHEPLELDVIADFVGEPGNQGQGGPGYEMEQYNKLAAFSNRDSTFKWTSYIFVHQTSYSQIVQPGLVIGGLGIKKFEAMKGNTKPINIIGAKINFRSVVFTADGDEISSDAAYSRGRQSMDGVSQDDATAATGAATASMDATAATGAATASMGAISPVTGSVPYQWFTVRIDGKDISFWLRGNDVAGYVTYGVAYNNVMLVDQRRLVYAEDMFAGVTASALRGLHVLPLDTSGKETDVTTDNLGRAVKLYVFKESNG